MIIKKEMVINGNNVKNDNKKGNGQKNIELFVLLLYIY